LLPTIVVSWLFTSSTTEASSGSAAIFDVVSWTSSAIRFPMVSQKGKPTFGWLGISGRSFHPAGNRSFRDIETEHEKFAVNTWCATE